jgi:hypothetical protein
MIYIQKDKYKDIPHHFDVACAMYGAMDSNLDYRLITYDDIDIVSTNFEYLFTKNNVFVGSVEFMKLVFGKQGIDIPKVPMNSNRVHNVDTLGNVKKQAQLGYKWFIKPFDIKLFTGFVIDQMQYYSIKNIPDDTEVMVYEPFKHPIESEWRCYINNHKLEYIANYSGDILVNVNGLYLMSVINSNKDTFPCAYTIDIGILTNGENVVIEYNDMWAIGNYGIPNDIYLRMLKNRYLEIIK